MIRSRLGLKALGLCAMLVGMFAFAGVAHAEKGAFWLVGGKTFTEGLLPTVEAETEVKGVLLTTLGGQEVDISCGTILLIGAHLVEPLGKILGKIIFHECDFLSLKGGVATLQKACEPFVKLTSGEKHKGLIETKSITGLIKLHEGKEVIEATPTEAGGQFAIINLGEECAFGEELKIGGVFFLADCEGKALTDLVKHLVEELPTLTKLTVNGGATPARIDGSAWAFLGGAHKGMTFAAHL